MKKEKIGILTFQNSVNFGALLQAFGMYQILTNLDYEPEIINYHSPNKAHMYKLLNLGFNLSIKDNIRGILGFPLKCSKFKKSSNFREKQLCIKKPFLTTYQELSDYQKRFQKIIVGSDQVWNYDNTNGDHRYFLDFISSDKKIAYAPSFGKSVLDEKYKEEYQKYLQDFPSISVRETDGRKIVEDLIGREVLQVLDPTLALSRKNWENMVKPYSKSKNYLVVYIVGNKDQTLNVAKQIAKEKGLKIILIATETKDYIKGVRAVNPSVNEFVGLIKNSSYVVTSSFHGLAFAITFNKQFTACLEKDAQRNSRQLSLLNLTNLSDRVSFDDNISNSENKLINWEQVNALLEKERQKSIDFLRHSLERNL